MNFPFYTYRTQHKVKYSTTAIYRIMFVRIYSSEIELDPDWKFRNRFRFEIAPLELNTAARGQNVLEVGRLMMKPDILSIILSARKIHS